MEYQLSQVRSLTPEQMDAEETNFYNRDCNTCEYQVTNKSDCKIGLCVKDEIR